DGIRDGHVTGVQTCALPISRRRCRTTLVIAEAHSLVLLPSVRSSFWSHRQELYPHTTACFCCASCASVGMIVHFISPQDKGMGRHLDISPTAEQRPFCLLAQCLEANASNLDISTILCDSGGN